MLLTSSTEEHHTQTKQEHFHVVRTAFSQRSHSFFPPLSLSICVRHTYVQCSMLSLRLKLKDDGALRVLCSGPG